MKKGVRSFFTNNEVRIELWKDVKETWVNIGYFPKHGDTKELRENAESTFRENCLSDLENKKNSKASREKKSVNLCIEKDERKRENIDGIKKEILDSLGSRDPTQNKVISEDLVDKNASNEGDEDKEENSKHKRQIDKAIDKKQHSYSIELAKKIAVENEAIKRQEKIPPRMGGKINVKFTKREFRNPARESKKEEEDEWLRRQAKAQQRKQKVKDDIQMDHTDILEKASHFFRVEDYASAEEILTCGIDIFPNSAKLYNNRTAVRLKTGNLIGCLEDSEKALDLMLPEVDANKSSRAAVRCRRAMALQALGEDVKALMELQIAEQILPENEKIKEDLEGLRKAINENENDSSSEEESVVHSSECREVKDLSVRLEQEHTPEYGKGASWDKTRNTYIEDLE